MGWHFYNDYWSKIPFDFHYSSHGMGSMVRKYRVKLPVKVEAIQFTEGLRNQAFEFVTNEKRATFDKDGNPTLTFQRFSRNSVFVGEAVASFGDWIVKGVTGDFFVCSSEDFAFDYELAEEIPDVSAATE